MKSRSGFPSGPFLSVMAILTSLCMPASAQFLQSLTVEPDAIRGSQTARGEVSMSFVTDPFVVVQLSSSHPAIASVPDQVLVPGTRPRVSFDITTVSVASAVTVTIRATYGHQLRSDTLDVLPPGVSSITTTSNTVTGGIPVLLTATLDAPSPVPAYPISLQSSLPEVVWVPDHIPVGLGRTSVLFYAQTHAVSAPTIAQITASAGGAQASTMLTVKPPELADLVLEPSAVTAGMPATGTVILDGMLAVDAEVTLSSSDPAAAVPASLQIGAGAAEASFAIVTQSVEGCRSVVISAAYGVRVLDETLELGLARQLTDNTADDRGNRIASNTRQGRVLWTDGDDVRWFDGSSVDLVQERGALDNVEDFVLCLGSGGAPGDVIGGWRRGTDFAWVWSSAEGLPRQVAATNPIDPNEPLNPEGVAIDDGCVFFILQAFFGGQAVKHVFRVDPSTGNTVNLTGNAVVPGVQRIAGSDCQAVWVYYDDYDEYADGLGIIQFYDGTSVVDVDEGNVTDPKLRNGLAVYTKDGQVFVYDARTQPAGLSQRTQDGGNTAAETDGQRVAWLHSRGDGTYDVVLEGDVLTTAANRAVPPPQGPALQFDHGQLMWRDAAETLWYYDGDRVVPLCVVPSTSERNVWLRDGYVVWSGTAADAQPDLELFRLPVTLPDGPVAWGDVDGNGVAGTVDAALMLQWDAFLIDAFPCCEGLAAPLFPRRADTGGDGVLGAVDASLILQYDALLISCFPADPLCPK